jgi:hypothetical protein
MNTTNRLWRYLVLLIILGVALGGLLLARRAIIESSHELSDNKARNEIRSVLDLQVAGWNKGDLEQFMAGYWNSEELTFRSGSKETKGWQATFDRYRKRYQQDGAEMGQLTFDQLEIEVFDRGRALVRGHWKLVMKEKSPEGWFTLELQKFETGWKIVYDHTSSDS